MPLSNDDFARRRQLRNLKHAPVHGAYSETRLAPLRERYAVELKQRFPSADPPEIALLANRQAQLTLLAEWQDRRGLLANRQRGTVFPAVALHERIAAAFERQYALLREREALDSRLRAGSALEPRVELDAEGRKALAEILRQRPAGPGLATPRSATGEVDRGRLCGL